MAIGRKNRRTDRAAFEGWTEKDMRRSADIEMPAVVWSNGFPLVFFWQDKDQSERAQFERMTR